MVTIIQRFESGDDRHAAFSIPDGNDPDEYIDFADDLRFQTATRIALPISSLLKHLVIYGGTGDGKSNVIFQGIVAALMRQTPAMVLAIQLGPTKFPYHYTQSLAAETQRAFRETHSNINFVSNPCNPLAVYKDLANPEVFKSCINLMGTSNSLAGAIADYWFKCDYITLKRATELLREQQITPSIPTFLKAIQRVAAGVRKSEPIAASLAFELLSLYPQLDPDSEPFSHYPETNYRELIENGGVSFLQLDGTSEKSALQLAAFHVWAVIEEQKQRSQFGKTPRQVFIVIDEFALVAYQPAFRGLETLVRGLHIGLIVILQTREQIEGEGNNQNVAAILDGNTAVQLEMRPSGSGLDRVQALSKTVLRPKFSYSASNGLSATFAEEPALSRNDILEQAFTGFHGFLMCLDGSGHQSPIPFAFTPEVDKDEYERLDNSPFPLRKPPPKNWLHVSGRSAGASQETLAAFDDMLRAIVTQMKGIENWDGSAS